MFPTNRQLDYPRYKTKNCLRSIDGHFRNGAGIMSLFYLPLTVAITSFMDICKPLPLRSQRCITKNRWRSIDTQFQDGAGNVSQLFLPLKAANKSFMDRCNRSPPRLPMMQCQTSWMLRWCSLSEWGSSRDISYFAHKGFQYVGYA